MDTSEDPSKWLRIRRYLSWKYIVGAIKSITIEPCYFMFAFSSGLWVISAYEMYIEKVCKVNLGFNDTICDNIQRNKEQQIEVQKYVTTLQMYNTWLQSIPSVIIALFAGSWSDLHGRKILITSSLFGYVISNAIFMINGYFFYELKAEYLLFECLQDLTGGSVVFFMACNAYLADVTNPKNRTKRVAFMTGLLYPGFNLGRALSLPIKAQLGLLHTFAFGMLAQMITVLYVIVFVPDSIRIREKRLKKQRTKLKQTGEIDLAIEDYDSKPAEQAMKSSFMDRAKSLFSLKNIKEAVKAIFSKRRHSLRHIILLMIFCFELAIFIDGGHGNSYLYLRLVFDWDFKDFGTYTIIISASGLIAQYIMIPFLSSVLKLRDSTIVLIDITGCFIKVIILIFAKSSWLVYLASFIAFLEATSYSMIRCMISKHVKPDEVGKILAFVGAIQAFIPIVSKPAFASLYRATLDYLPQAYFILEACLLFVQWCTLVYIDRGTRNAGRKMAIEANETKKVESEDNAFLSTKT